MHIYLGIFLTALSTLAFETVLTRLLSVISWYYLAFFAVSTAMLGMTAGAVTVFLKPRSFEPSVLDDNTAKAAMAFGISIPVALTVLCFTPIVYTQTLSSVLKILLASFFCVVPFYFSGIVTTAVLTKQKMPVGRLYAADLAGASLGCLFVLWGLDLMDAPDLILLCGPVAGLAAASFAWRSKKSRIRTMATGVFSILAVILVFNVFEGHLLRPYTIKEGRSDGRGYVFQKWNSFSWVTVQGMVEGSPRYWAPSPVAPAGLTERYQYFIIDGLAATHMVGFDSDKDIEFLKYDMVNIAYNLRVNGKVCVIGVGGGRDITSAVAFGYRDILGLEVNPIFTGLLKDRFLTYANLANRDGIRLVTDDARSWLARSKEKFSLIQMSLIDTWAATGAGAFSLTENGLYTLEAWDIFLDRLQDGGVFTVSRWYNHDTPGETARIISLAMVSLFRKGVADPSKNIILTSTGNCATLLMSNRPFSGSDLETIWRTCDRLKWAILVFPGESPRNEYLRRIMESKSQKELYGVAADAPLNYLPPTDETPYFFNMLKLGRLDYSSRNSGMVQGNLLANLTLMILIGVLLLFAALTIILPLLFGKKAGKKIRLPAAAYFSLIGAGFMLAEMGLIQKLSVFLGNPVYALGILLFSMIASAGSGSYLSEKMPLDKKPWIRVYPAATGAYLLFLIFFMPVMARAMVAAPMEMKIPAVLLVIIPLGIMMGMCFPAGMRIIGRAEAGSTPWYWALNGIFGVLCSALAVFISIYSGISMNLYISAACYLSLLFCVEKMGKT
jgi:spermidine synthase